MIVFSQQIVPLTYERLENGARKSGLSVTVSVINAETGATLLASTTVPELGSTGIYTYQWAHGLLKDTVCEVAYTVGSRTIREVIQISFSAGMGGRGI